MSSIADKLTLIFCSDAQPTRTSSPSPNEPTAATAANIGRLPGNQHSRLSPLRPARMDDDRSAVSAPAAEPIPEDRPTDSNHGHEEGDSPREPGDATHDGASARMNGETWLSPELKGRHCSTAPQSACILRGREQCPPLQMHIRKHCLCDVLEL